MFTQRSLMQWLGLLLAVTLVAVASADETIHIQVDVASPAGKIRRLHGTNLAAPLDSGSRTGMDTPAARF